MICGLFHDFFWRHFAGIQYRAKYKRIIAKMIEVSTDPRDFKFGTPFTLTATKSTSNDISSQLISSCVTMYSSDYKIIATESQSEPFESSPLNPVVDKCLNRWKKAICMCTFLIYDMFSRLLTEALIFLFFNRLLGSCLHCGNHYTANRIPIHLRTLFSSYGAPLLQGKRLFRFICELHCSGIIFLNP